MIKKFKNLSKGAILIELEKNLSHFQVPKTKIFKVSDWLSNKEKILKNITNHFFIRHKIKILAIRSSAHGEDKTNNSKAGMYDSVLNVKTTSKKDVINAITKVFKSYKAKKNSNILKSEIIVQEMILKVHSSGVIFTHDLNDGSPYYVVNYDDKTGLTNTVTSGSNIHSNMSLNVSREKINELRSQRFKKLLYSVKELELVLGSKYIDIEFVIDKKLNIYLLQVREISNKKIWNKKEINSFKKIIKKTDLKFQKIFKKQKGVIGKTSVFGQMPDWNPAEIIGKTPRDLSYSIYKKLITDKIWSQARKEMGYKIPKNKSLMTSFGGHPYIDTRLSLNSFLPKKLTNSLSEKIINFWLEKLKHNPILHDKIEFDLAITCYSFDIKSKLNNLVGPILTKNEKKIYMNHLKDLTIKSLDSSSKFSIQNTLKKIEILKEKQKLFKNQGKLDQINQLIKECRIYGTLPFSILARHGFIGVTLLNSIKELKILKKEEVNLFVKNIKTIATDMVVDFNHIKKNKDKKKRFFIKYGHLRPGTYDIMSKSYDEKSYFQNNTKINILKKNNNLKLNSTQIKLIDKLLADHGFKKINYQQLFEYIHDAIVAREYSKFIFTKNVSNILKVLIKYGNKNSINRSILSFINIKNFLKKNIIKSELLIQSKKNENYFKIASALKLPQIIHDQTNAFIAPYQINIPNFITSKHVEGKPLQISSKMNSQKLDGKIILIEGADPGYDWIFSHKIIGLVTKYGGANSHMAIRSAEFELPAVIGCGDNLFNELINYEFISINCSTKAVKEVILN